MSVPSNQTELLKSGRTWITLVASTTALLVLFAWALRNPHTLLRDKAVAGEIAITNQSDSDLPLSENTASQADLQGEAVPTTGEVELLPEQTASQQTGVKRATDDVEQRLVEQLASNTVGTGKSEAKSDVADAPVAQKGVTEDVDPEQSAANDSATPRPAAAKSDQLSTDSTFAEKQANEKIALDKELADKLAAEKAAAEQKAAEQKAAEQKAAEQKAAEQKAAEQKAAEQKAAEQKAAEQKAAEQKAAEQKAAEQKAAEQKAAEQKAAEQKAAEEKALKVKAAAVLKLAEERLAEAEATTDANSPTGELDKDNQSVEQLAALPLPSAGTNNAAPQVVPENETAFEKSRREDLAKLQELASRIRFATNDTETTGNSKELLERMFELLFLYSETTVTVQVGSNEYEEDDTNQLLSRLRSRVIINYLVQRGLDEGRFNVLALGKQGLPFDAHLVSVVAKVIENGDR